VAKSLSIAWFRQDLRIHDNPALRAAAEYDSVLLVYILDDQNAADQTMGSASRVWLHHSLKALNASLGGRLQLFVGDASTILQRLTTELDVDAIFWNRCYEPWRMRRDNSLKQKLLDSGLHCRSFNASLLWEPWTVLKKDDSPYRVYTPFYRNGCAAAPTPREPLSAPTQLACHNQDLQCSQPLSSLSLLPAHSDWHESTSGEWLIGESGATTQLQRFCKQCLDQYKPARDFPALDATSRLSPHLHFGEISPHQVWHRIQQETFHHPGEGPAHFLREIAWREFSYYLLYHFPKLPQQNFNPRFDGFEWRKDSEGLKRWQRGQTGFPIIDAGMRELWQTGYMHNRVRMIVASFLVKNLMIHWREGAAWFWDCLFDADLASNSASWQWVAGSGADAAPYFRIFNPILQSEKFDPEGEYLLRYCPELGGLSSKLRHQPWSASAEQLQVAGLRLGIDYPRPIVDLKTTRERALNNYRALG